MDITNEDHLTNKEKSLVAMGAAMGAGCRTCADKLYEVALSLNIAEKDMLGAFLLGLDAKAEAVHTMKTKISNLIGEDKAERIGENPGKLASLVRIAAFVAANSAPDVLSEIQRAQEHKSTPDQIQLCISIGKMVRKNAVTFSDQEISDSVRGSEPGGEELCCPVSPGAKNASACSCG